MISEPFYVYHFAMIVVNLLVLDESLVGFKRIVFYDLLVLSLLNCILPVFSIRWLAVICCRTTTAR